MEPGITKNHNNIFKYAFAGALLFIAAFGFTLANLSSILTLELSYMLISGILAAAAISLLYKAIKADKQRLQL